MPGKKGGEALKKGYKSLTEKGLFVRFPPLFGLLENCIANYL